MSGIFLPRYVSNYSDEYFNQEDLPNTYSWLVLLSHTMTVIVENGERSGPTIVFLYT